jgi:hypothetical protein
MSCQPSHSDGDVRREIIYTYMGVKLCTKRTADEENRVRIIRKDLG